MSCLLPTKRYRLHDGKVVTAERWLRSEKNPPIGQFWTPCGQCGECRLSRARSYATRAVHEATQWKKSCFITLTYNKPPPKNSLNPLDTRNFIRKFRYHFGKPFKYFLCGEYGDKNDRPHYHALIFGYDFGLSEATNLNNKLSTNLTHLHDTTAFHCPELDDLWELGFTSVGELTFDSAAYTAQYAIKKINGPKAKDHYGERLPEFMRQSQDALGKQYALKYSQEIIQNNSVISNFVNQPIPRYYLKQYEKQKLDLTQLKSTREEFSETHTLEKSYIRACNLDSKFKLKISKADSLRSRYIKESYFNP